MKCTVIRIVSEDLVLKKFKYWNEVIREDADRLQTKNRVILGELHEEGSRNRHPLYIVLHGSIHIMKLVLDIDNYFS